MSPSPQLLLAQQWLGLVLEYGSIAAGAVAGALAAGRKQFDWLGVVILAVATAIGGGTIRDLLLNRPVFWIAHPAYLHAALLAGLGTLVIARRRRIPPWLLDGFDTVGLAFFSINAARVTLQLGHSSLIAVVMGTITGVFGGLVRDVLVNEVPMIFRRGQLYGTAVIAGCGLYVALMHYGLAPKWAAALGTLTVMLLRAAAMVFNIRLPVFNPVDQP